jgi:phosphatidate cytidylyltransferase
LDSVATSARGARAAHGLATRTATAVLGIPITVLLVILGRLWLLGGIAALVAVGLVEFYRMAERGGYRPIREAGIGAGLLFALTGAYASPWEMLILPALLVYSVLVQLRHGRPGQWLVNTAITALGALYVGYLFSYVERLRGLSLAPAHADSPVAALLVICVAWGADTAAYFVGVAAGRHKLLPEVSPNKSLEGAGAAILAGVAVGLVFSWAAGVDRWMSVAVGALGAAASVCGDLWESAIKREAGVKDAGGVLPGHGGVLDRFDGLLFAAVTGYAVMTWWPRS